MHVATADQPMTTQRVRVADAVDVPSGSRKLVTTAGREIALFNVDGVIYAINNRCPHKSGPLIRGYIDGRGIKCPMHGWRYDLATGQSERPAAATVYAVTVEDGGVFIDIDARGPGTPTD
jgi:nitrite reductase/ring-hydroxylating ferredoxin subunit